MAEMPDWNALGMTLGGSGRLNEAERPFVPPWHATEVTTSTRSTLASLSRVNGRGREAREYFEKTLLLAPDFAAAREELRKLGADRTGQ